MLYIFINTGYNMGMDIYDGIWYLYHHTSIIPFRSAALFSLSVSAAACALCGSVRSVMKKIPFIAGIGFIISTQI